MKKGANINLNFRLILIALIILTIFSFSAVPINDNPNKTSFEKNLHLVNAKNIIENKNSIHSYEVHSL